MGRHVLNFWHMAAHAARGSIKTTHIPSFDYSSLQNTNSQLVFFGLSFRSQNQLEPFSSRGQHIFVQYHYVKMSSILTSSFTMYLGSFNSTVNKGTPDVMENIGS